MKIAETWQIEAYELSWFHFHLTVVSVISTVCVLCGLSTPSVSVQQDVISSIATHTRARTHINIMSKCVDLFGRAQNLFWLFNIDSPRTISFHTISTDNFGGLRIIITILLLLFDRIKRSTEINQKWERASNDFDYGWGNWKKRQTVPGYHLASTITNKQTKQKNLIIAEKRFRQQLDWNAYDHVKVNFHFDKANTE